MIIWSAWSPDEIYADSYGDGLKAIWTTSRAELDRHVLRITRDNWPDPLEKYDGTIEKRNVPVNWTIRKWKIDRLNLQVLLRALNFDIPGEAIETIEVSVTPRGITRLREGR